MRLFSNKKNSEMPDISLKPQFEEEQSQENSGWNDKNPIDFLSMVLEYKLSLKIVLFDASALKQPKSVAILSQAADDFLADFCRRVEGRIFELSDKSVILAFKDTYEDEFQAVLIRLQFIFNDEMAFENKSDITQADFFHIYTEASEFQALRSKLIQQQPPQAPEVQKTPKISIPGKMVSVSGNTKKRWRELSPAILDKMQKSLLQVDFSSLIRRQAVCAVIGHAAPQMIFEEVYVSIPDLRDILLPDVDIKSNPWLFMHLTETLDKRVLAHISQHDDGSLVSNFSMNLNVSTILSDEFLAFDESIPAPLRSSIVLELQLVDIFNDVKAFLLAKAFAQYRGYKICIDGITVDKLQYINRENLNSDLMKIFWHPSFLDVINEDKHFRDYVNKAERAKMILCRVDDAKAIEVGNSIGINLYQGRYVQKELNKNRK